VLFVAVPLVAGGVVALASPAATQSLNFVKVWSATVTDGSPISQSSPNVATLDGMPAVVVGDQGAHIYAFSLGSGAPVPGWPASAGGVPVGSTPSVAALGPGSPNDTVFVGAGYAGRPHEGGYEAFNPDGARRWYVAVHNPGASFVSGVVGSLAVGDLQGSTDVVGPSIGEEQDAINAATGAVLPGFPWFQADGDYATPALADLYGNGKTEIIEGGGQTAGNAYGAQYPQGGHVRVLSVTGNAGTNNPAGGLECNYNPGQSVDSSPAVGRFLAGGAEGIVVGTGDFWPGAPGTDKLVAVSAHCNLVWSTRLDGLTTSSPALADLDGNGTLAVVEGTNNRHGGGSIYALNGSTGSVLWRQTAAGEVVGSVVTANLGAGYQDVIVAGTGGAEVLDGRDGHVVAVLEKGVGLQNSALVTDDPNGTIGITVAGYNAYDRGEVEHFELAGSNGGEVDQAGSWPMFHHDPRLSGNAEAPI
jgi:hypothetical protein